MPSDGRCCCRDQRFVCTFRFKMWWMTQRMGSAGRDIPSETQFLLVEVSGGGEQPAVVYTVFLPVLEGSFRAVLQGNADDELEICLESGKQHKNIFSGLANVYCIVLYCIVLYFIVLYCLFP
jgi:raffinose synthase